MKTMLLSGFLKRNCGKFLAVLFSIINQDFFVAIISFSLIIIVFVIIIIMFLILILFISLYFQFIIIWYFIKYYYFIFFYLFFFPFIYFLFQVHFCSIFLDLFTFLPFFSFCASNEFWLCASFEFYYFSFIPTAWPFENPPRRTPRLSDLTEKTKVPLAFVVVSLKVN